MIAAIPTNNKEQGLNSGIADHFGRCLAYMLFDGNGILIKKIKNNSQHGGGRGLPPEIMKEHGVDAVLCRDMGPRAVELCRRFAIDVYIHRESETAKDILDEWRSGRLKKALKKDACSDHEDNGFDKS